MIFAAVVPSRRRSRSFQMSSELGKLRLNLDFTEFCSKNNLLLIDVRRCSAAVSNVVHAAYRCWGIQYDPDNRQALICQILDQANMIST